MAGFFKAGLSLAVVLLLFTTEAKAQGQRDFGGYQLPSYCKEDDQLPQASKKICQILRQELPKFNQVANGYGKQVARRVHSSQGDIPTRTVTLQGKTFGKIAIRSEKDLNDGHYPRSKAWRHYTGDSRTILHVQRFIECFEPRKVEQHPSYEPLCEANCPNPTSLKWPCKPELTLPPYFNQKKYVWEYYVPEFEIIVAKAGSHSVDPTMFDGKDNRPEFLRSATMQTQKSTHDPQALADLKSDHGIATEKWKDPAWRQGEFLLQQGEGPMDVTQPAQVYAKALQPNFVWRFASLRPAAWWQGWGQNDLSAAWCWPKRNQEIFSNSQDQQLLWKTANIVEYTRLVSPEMWQATVNLPTQIRQVGKTEQMPQGLAPSFRRARYGNPYNDLERLDINSSESANQDKYIFYGGTVGPLTNTRFNMFTDPLRRDFFLAVTAAWEFGSKSGALRAYNTETRRQPMLTYHANRESKAGYEGDKNKDHQIRVIDKFSNVWPGKERSTSGAPGEPLKCTRPNNAPNLEVDDNWPKDMATKLEYDGETRWIFWNKRIACACELCGVFRGCLTMNNGDFEEDTFEGTTPGTIEGGGGLPPPFEQARPHWLRLSSATSTGRDSAGHWDGFNIPGGTDMGTPGPLQGILNQSTTPVPQQPPSEVQEQPQQPPENGEQQPEEEQQQQEQQQQEPPGQDVQPEAPEGSPGSGVADPGSVVGTGDGSGAGGLSRTRRDPASLSNATSGSRQGAGIGRSNRLIDSAHSTSSTLESDTQRRGSSQRYLYRGSTKAGDNSNRF